MNDEIAVTCELDDSYEVISPSPYRHACSIHPEVLCELISQNELVENEALPIYKCPKCSTQVVTTDILQPTSTTDDKIIRTISSSIRPMSSTEYIGLSMAELQNRSVKTEFNRMSLLRKDSNEHIGKIVEPSSRTPTTGYHIGTAPQSKISRDNLFSSRSVTNSPTFEQEMVNTTTTTTSFCSCFPRPWLFYHDRKQIGELDSCNGAGKLSHADSIDLAHKQTCGIGVVSEPNNNKKKDNHNINNYAFWSLDR